MLITFQVIAHILIGNGIRGIFERNILTCSTLWTKILKHRIQGRFVVPAEVNRENFYSLKMFQVVEIFKLSTNTSQSIHINIQDFIISTSYDVTHSNNNFK